MEIKGKIHCLFEQSGTFKNEFKKLGYEAYDYDIQNNFGETDFVIDLFKEIENAYRGGASVFDNMKPDDFIMAFFPCIAFCNMAEFNQRSMQEKWRRDGMPVKRIYELLKKRSDERYFFYQTCLKMHEVVETRGLRMCMENPWNEVNYTNYFWFAKPQVIDIDRRRRGDFFVKPTAYWFTNCKPTNGESFSRVAERDKKIVGMTTVWRKKKIGVEVKNAAKGSSKHGLCSEERSMISPTYASNWICDFVLGKEQNNSIRSLF